MSNDEKVMVPGQDSSDSDRGQPVTKDEEGARRYSIGHISENRETDFWTRNGLNLRSFQRRELHTVLQSASLKLTGIQVPMTTWVWSLSITQ